MKGRKQLTELELQKNLCNNLLHDLRIEESTSGSLVSSRQLDGTG